MFHRVTLIREPVKILEDYNPSIFQPHENHTTRQDYATETLIEVADDQDDRAVKDKQRNEHNGSQITCWNNNYLNNVNILKQQCQNNRRKRKFKIRLERQSLKEPSYLENAPITPNICLSIKKQINKLRLPLRERTFNSEQFASLTVEKEKSKTRNQIKSEIMSWKQQITPVGKTRNKVKSSWKCHNIIRDRDESKQYRRIKRKDFYTIQNDEECISEENMGKMLRTRSKNEPRVSMSSPKVMNLRGNSIKRLFIE